MKRILYKSIFLKIFLILLPGLHSHQKLAHLLIQRVGGESHGTRDYNLRKERNFKYFIIEYLLINNKFTDLSRDCVEDLLVLEYYESSHVSHNLTLQELFTHVDLKIHVNTCYKKIFHLNIWEPHFCQVVCWCHKMSCVAPASGVVVDQYPGQNILMFSFNHFRLTLFPPTWSPCTARRSWWAPCRLSWTPRRCRFPREHGGNDFQSKEELNPKRWYY